MVEFIDGSILAQLAVTDMRLPIQYALTYPERLDTKLKPLDLINLKSLTLGKPVEDIDLFISYLNDPVKIFSKTGKKKQ